MLRLNVCSWIKRPATSKLSLQRQAVVRLYLLSYYVCTKNCCNSVSQSISEGQSFSQSLSVSKSVSGSGSQSVNQPESASQSVGLAVNQQVGQSARKSVSYPTSRSVSLSLRTLRCPSPTSSIVCFSLGQFSCVSDGDVIDLKKKKEEEEEEIDTTSRVRFDRTDEISTPELPFMDSRHEKRSNRSDDGRRAECKFCN